MVTALKVDKVPAVCAALNAAIALLTVTVVTVEFDFAKVFVAADEIETATLETDVGAASLEAVGAGTGCGDVILGTAIAPTAFTAKSMTNSNAGAEEERPT